MNKENRESLHTCPFNPSHQILPHRMPQHLIRCKKNHPDADVKTCLFNKTHIVPTSSFQAHLEKCPDKASIERDMYAVNGQTEWFSSEPDKIINTSTEDWGSETQYLRSSYNPKFVALTKPFARPPPSGLGKAQRVKWRKEEALRIEHLKQGKPITDLYPELYAAELHSLQMDCLTSNLSASSITEKEVEPQTKPKTGSRPRIAANIYSGCVDKDKTGTENTVHGKADINSQE